MKKILFISILLSIATVIWSQSKKKSKQIEEYKNQGAIAFNNKNYVDALEYFKKSLSISGGYYSDDAVAYNAALAAYNGEFWLDAEKYFKLCIDNKYGGGDAVLLLHQVYGTIGNVGKMEDNLIKGFENYPEDERILTSLINYYLENKQNKKGLDYLNKAIAGEPNNDSYYYARGVIYDNSKKFNEALSDYFKCLEINSENFNALYNLGVMYYNKGIEEMNIADAELTPTGIEAKRLTAKDTFKKSIPYFEKALTIRPNDPTIVESLKVLSERFNLDTSIN